MKGSKPIAIGVMSQGKLRQRVLAIARGDYKPKASDPKIWFTSMKAAASVLSDENRALLRTIAATKPASIAALAAETRANVRRVSRTLKILSRYGLVDLLPSGTSLRPVPRARRTASWWTDRTHHACVRLGVALPNRCSLVASTLRNMCSTCATFLRNGCITVASFRGPLGHGDVGGPSWRATWPFLGKPRRR